MEKKIFSAGLSLFISFLIFIPPLYSQDENAAAHIFKTQADTIVLIQAKTNRETRLGSGFIISVDGKIITNYHIIRKAKEILVKLRNKKIYQRVSVVNVDSRKDIAIIKIEADNLLPVQFGDSRKMQIGERVIAIGNPLGLESTISDGLISSIRDTLKGFHIFQISVPLSPGSSGGPLFNLKGEVIGITTASAANGQSLNFAIPLNDVKPLLFESPLHVRKKEQMYTVLPGDTLYSLARKYHTTVEAIVQRNHLRETKIYTGQRIRIR